MIEYDLLPTVITGLELLPGASSFSKDWSTCSHIQYDVTVSLCWHVILQNTQYLIKNHSMNCNIDHFIYVFVPKNARTFP